MIECIEFIDLNDEYLDEISEFDKLCFSDNWSKAIFQNELQSPNSHCAVAFLSGKIIGYYAISTVLDEADITKIAVHPDYRKCGIGSKLVDLVFDYCKEHGINLVHLEFRESNSSAFALYNKKGFEIVGERKKYYNNSETAILMTKILKEV